MGGKNCVIVDADADLDEAVPAIVHSAFGYAGQKCSACARVLAHEAVADALLERLARRRRRAPGRPGGRARPPTCPPVIERGGARAGDALRRGRRPSRAVAVREPRAGRGLVLPADRGDRDLPADAPVLREEVFGPLLAVERGAGVEEALRARRRAAVRAHRRAVLPQPGDRRAGRARTPVGNLYVNRGITGAMVGPPALRRQPALGHRRQGGRPGLPAPVHRAARRDREHHAARPGNGLTRRISRSRGGREAGRYPAGDEAQPPEGPRYRGRA